jgi:hypothetical protein
MMSLVLDHRIQAVQGDARVLGDVEARVARFDQIKPRAARDHTTLDHFRMCQTEQPEAIGGQFGVPLGRDMEGKCWSHTVLPTHCRTNPAERVAAQFIPRRNLEFSRPSSKWLADTFQASLSRILAALA